MRIAPWLDPSGLFLGDGFPLPSDRPFTAAMALEAGISRRRLAGLISDGLVRGVVTGVYAPSQVEDDLRLRVAALGLVVPDHAVVIDRAAGWLHGMPVLRRGAHLTVPPVEVGHTTQSRSIRPEVDGHRRGLLPRDVTTIRGVRATTPLRTALDLGRLLWRFDALSALDAAARTGVDPDEMAAESERFRGYRGVRQLRVLLSLVDAGAESPPESALRLHWLMAGLPRPTTQLWVDGPDGDRYRLDLTLPELGYAAEYDGLEFHGPLQLEHDCKRRDWLRSQGWMIDVFGKHDVYTPGTSIQDRLAASFSAARRRGRAIDAP
jgi:hypothetical protein